MKVKSGVFMVFVFALVLSLSFGFVSAQSGSGQESCYWTDFNNADSQSSGGDFDNLNNLQGNPNNDLCSNSTIVDANCSAMVPVNSGASSALSIDELKNKPRVAKMEEQVTDINYNSLNNLQNQVNWRKLSNRFQKINLQMKRVDYTQTGESVSCTNNGVVCNDNDQSDGHCDFNYQVQFRCGDGSCQPPSSGGEPSSSCEGDNVVRVDNVEDMRPNMVESDCEIKVFPEKTNYGEGQVDVELYDGLNGTRDSINFDTNKYPINVYGVHYDKLGSSSDGRERESAEGVAEFENEIIGVIAKRGGVLSSSNKDLGICSFSKGDTECDSGSTIYPLGNGYRGVHGPFDFELGPGSGYYGDSLELLDENKLRIYADTGSNVDNARVITKAGNYTVNQTGQDLPSNNTNFTDSTKPSPSKPSNFCTGEVSWTKIFEVDRGHETISAISHNQGKTFDLGLPSSESKFPRSKEINSNGKVYSVELVSIDSSDKKVTLTITGPEGNSYTGKVEEDSLLRKSMREFVGLNLGVVVDPRNTGSNDEVRVFTKSFCDSGSSVCAIKCLAKMDGQWVDYTKTGENVVCRKDVGVVCDAKKQDDGSCDYNYAVKFGCSTKDISDNGSQNTEPDEPRPDPRQAEPEQRNIGFFGWLFSLFGGSNDSGGSGEKVCEGNNVVRVDNVKDMRPNKREDDCKIKVFPEKKGYSQGNVGVEITKSAKEKGSSAKTLDTSKNPVNSYAVHYDQEGKRGRGASSGVAEFENEVIGIIASGEALTRSNKDLGICNFSPEDTSCSSGSTIYPLGDGEQNSEPHGPFDLEIFDSSQDTIEILGPNRVEISLDTGANTDNARIITRSKECDAEGIADCVEEGVSQGVQESLSNN